MAAQVRAAALLRSLAHARGAPTFLACKQLSGTCDLHICTQLEELLQQLMVEEALNSELVHKHRALESAIQLQCKTAERLRELPAEPAAARDVHDAASRRLQAPMADPSQGQQQPGELPPDLPHALSAELCFAANMVLVRELSVLSPLQVRLAGMGLPGSPLVGGRVAQLGGGSMHVVVSPVLHRHAGSVLCSLLAALYWRSQCPSCTCPSCSCSS